MKKTLLALFTVCILLITACSFEYPEVIDVKKLRFKSLKKSQLAFSINPIVNNPNDVPLWVDKVKTKIYIDGKYVGDSDSDEHINLKASGDTEFTLECMVKVKDFKKQIPVFLRKDSVSVVVDGDYTFKTKVKDFSFNYKYETYINPKKELATLLLGF